MDSNEQRNDIGLPQEPDRQIQLVVNRPQTDEVTIDLGNVFYNMKRRRRLFAWVLVLCLVAGFCAPLVLYQINKPMLTVSSVVTLQYEVPTTVIRDGKRVIADNPTYTPVSDLTAPDGQELDLNQITSAYVLQTALDGITLSQPITAANLRANISIQTVLTEESQRIRESLRGLAELKNAEAYNQLQNTEMRYRNRFVVSLRNGFGNEDSRIKMELKDDELSRVLDRVLNVYNDYLVRTYADIRLPEDKFSVIDTEELDVLDSLDELRAGIEDLETYCEEKTDTVKAYRSWRTGRSLTDWTETLQTFRNINVDYLYTLVSENAITRDRTALLTNYKFILRNTQNDLQETSESIEETKKILANYKNDDIYITMQESDGSKSTKASTEYYNKLVLQLADSYDIAAELKTTAADYEERIQRLEKTERTEVTAEVEAELTRSLTSAQSLYDEIRDHMEELFDSPLYTTYEQHSVPQGKLDNYLVASAKKIIIGMVAGAVIAFGLWFLAGLAPELNKGRKEQEGGKEGDRK